MTLLVQGLSIMALLVLITLLLLAGKASVLRWAILLRRARWLLLTLWLVLAYSIPGLIYKGWVLAPSEEGMLQASEQFLRLICMLGSLAILTTHLSPTKLMYGLWSLTRRLLPSAWADTTVARLALVMEYVGEAPPKGSWKTALLAPQRVAGDESVYLEPTPWQLRDTAAIILLPMAAIMVGVLV